MLKFTTKIMAICPNTGELTEFTGPNVPGISFADARRYCDTNGLGYCEIRGMIKGEYIQNGPRKDFEPSMLN